MKKYSVIFISLLLFFIPCLSVNASSRFCLDFPKDNSLYGDQLYVQGWIMSDEDVTLEYLIDNKVIDSIVNRYKRDDVISAIKGYGGIFRNPTPGFNSYVDISKIRDGNHTFSVKFYNKSKLLIQEIKRTIYIDKTASILRIDNPQNDSVWDNKLFLSGWVMSSNSLGSLHVYIDDKEVSTDLNRIERADVIEKIVGYGDAVFNPKPGFTSFIDIDEFLDGNHVIRVDYSLDDGTVLSSWSKNFSIKRNIADLRIDSPQYMANGDALSISGWVMSPNTDVRINTYLDDELLDIKLNRYSRSDVIEKITGYGDVSINKFPGYNASYDISNYKDGNHTLRVEVVNKDNVVIKYLARNFVLNKYNSTIRLDSIVEGNTYKGIELGVGGWILSNDKNSNLEIYIDNELVDVNIDRYERLDAINAYGANYDKSLNKLAGYSSIIDLSSYKDGNHTVKVIERDKKTNEEVVSISKNFKLKKYDSIIRLDSIVNGSTYNGPELGVGGWILSNDKNSNLEIYIDNELVDVNIDRYERLDAINAYGANYDKSLNKLAGYSSVIDLSSYKDGNHTVKVVERDKKTNEEVISISKNFKLKKYDSIIRLDSIVNDNTYIGTDLSVSGWILSNDKNSDLEIYIDNKLVDVNIDRYERLDAINAYGANYDKSLNKLAGYSSIIDLSSYKDGNHTVKVIERDKNTLEEVISITRMFKLRKFDGFIHLDYPSRSHFNNSTSLLVQGWELSESKDSIIKIYFDSVELNLGRYERTDVLNAYKDSIYTQDNNLQPGFSTTIDLSKYAVGSHKIKILLYTTYGDLIDEVEKDIYVYDNMYFGIDVSQYQYNNNWQAIASAGIDFAIIRLGYGDNFSSQDDTKFIENVNGCVKNNIPYGVYLYSYATNLHGASGLNQNSESIDSEIQHTLRLLNSLNAEQKSMLKLPVFLDMEDDSTTKLGKANLTTFADHYCGNIQNNGYKCGIYANRNWLSNYLDANYLSSKYDIWLASWTYDFNTLSSYNGIYQVWQYSDNGNVLGVGSPTVDLDISFKKYW